MKAARTITFLALCMMGTAVSAQCNGLDSCGGGSSGYGCGQGYNARAYDCGFASTLWSGFCAQQSGADCGCAPPCDTGCGLLSRLRDRVRSMGGDCGCTSGCGGFNGWGTDCSYGCQQGCGDRHGCGILSWLHSFGGGSCGSCCSSGCGGSGMMGSWTSMGSTCCDSCCDDQSGGLSRHIRGLFHRVGGCGNCQGRYGSLCGFESMCNHVRNYGSYRSWIGGGPLDSCGLVSYNSFPEQSIDYSYLNHVTQPAYADPVARASSIVGSQPTETAPIQIAPASNCACEGAPVALPMDQSSDGYIDGIQGTSTTQDDVSQSLYDETHSFGADKSRQTGNPESIPAGKTDSDE